MSNTPVALVTGATRGIGRAIALRLAGEGMHVMLTGRDEEALAEVAREIAIAGGRSSQLALDLRQPGAGAILTAFALEQGGRIDVLVNNAGATKRGKFLELTEADWEDGFALKLFGAVGLTRAAWPHLTATQGSVVNIAGVGGKTPGAEFSVGGSVNAAIMAWTKSLAELGIESNVQVNAINPGAVRTGRLTKRLTAMVEREGIDPVEAERRFVRQENVTRIGEPEEIANLVWFIVSPAGRFLHGALLDMDGGATKGI